MLTSCQIKKTCLASVDAVASQRRAPEPPTAAHFQRLNPDAAARGSGVRLAGRLTGAATVWFE
jgi:hypothetical protein